MESRILTGRAVFARPVGLYPAGSKFNPESLFKDGSIGDWWETGDLSTLFIDSAGTIPVTEDLDLVGRWVGKRGLWFASQTNTANKPKWDVASKSVLCGPSKFLYSTSAFLMTNPATDVSFFLHYKRSGLAASWNYGYPLVQRFNGYGNAAGFKDSHSIISPSGNIGPYYSIPPVPDETNYHSTGYSQGLGNVGLYYNDYTTQYLNPGYLPGLRFNNNNGGGEDFLFGYTDDETAPVRKYHLKMALLIRKSLTQADYALLHAYASSLP